MQQPVKVGAYDDEIHRLMQVVERAPPPRRLSMFGDVLTFFLNGCEKRSSEVKGGFRPPHGR